LDTIEEEGFHYAFVDYSDWEEIKDVKFHELLKRYQDATSELRKYIGYDE
jgi:hypothetical protein